MQYVNASPRQRKEPDNPAGVYCEQFSKYLVLVRNLSELTKATFLLPSAAIGLAGINPFKGGSAHSLESQLPVVLTGCLKGLLSGSNLFGKVIPIVTF